MRITRLVPLACAILAPALVLGGCAAKSRSIADRPVTFDIARDGRVDIVNVDYVPVMREVGPDFPYVFERHVKRKLQDCAHGSRPLRLDARVTQFQRTDPAVTALILGSNRIRGTAVLTDLQTGKVVGRYRIGRNFVGGAIGLPAMAPAEARLSAAFGGEVCRKAFPKHPAEPAADAGA